MFFDVGGDLLHVVSFGSGPKTLVAHGGWVGSWELWLQPFELLSPDWRCVSYDHRGSGESPVSPTSITPDALVDDLFAVLDGLGIDRCVVAGESLGAVVVMQAALRAPERFDGVVVVDGAPMIDVDSVQPLIAGARTDYRSTVAAFVEACVPGPSSDHLRRWGRHLLDRADPESAARLLECYLETPTVVPVDEIEVPTLIIHSTDDVIVPHAVGESLARQIPDATFVSIEGGGHVPTVTRPGEVVDAIRGRFGA